MTTLYDYLKQVQRSVRDADQSLLNPEDLIDYINRARREIVMRAECLRALPPTSGGIETITVTNPGSNYTNPVVTITAPDSPAGNGALPNGAQATAVAILANGTISSIDVTYGGSGYFQPQVTITDPTGTGATATAVTSPIMTANMGQEVYSFADIPLDNFPGYGEVYAVRSVSILYANYRYSLPQYAFSEYQAMIRQFAYQYSYVPTLCSQFGQGASGSLYLYPLPSQTFQLELDCMCWPQDLATDQDAEAIPEPWTQTVPYLATHYAYLELQNLNAAEYYRRMADRLLPIYRNAVTPTRRINPYGRY